MRKTDKRLYKKKKKIIIIIIIIIIMVDNFMLEIAPNINFSQEIKTGTPILWPCVWLSKVEYLCLEYQQLLEL